MTTTVRPDDLPGSGRLGLALGLAAVLVLVAAGGLLWARQGSAVFSEALLGAMAWCF